MNRETLERMTKEELMELVNRQNDAILALDQQRYDSSAVIEHLVAAMHDMHNLRYHDMERSHCQDYLDDFVREMYMKYPMYIVSAEVSKVEDLLNNPLDLPPDDMKGQPLQGEQ